jgi:hypothetical protein
MKFQKNYDFKILRGYAKFFEKSCESFLKNQIRLHKKLFKLFFCVKYIVYIPVNTSILILILKYWYGLKLMVVLLCFVLEKKMS